MGNDNRLFHEEIGKVSAMTTLVVWGAQISMKTYSVSGSLTLYRMWNIVAFGSVN